MRTDIDAAPSLARIRDGDAALGAGFLIAPDLVLTCAHVVADATGHEDVPVEPPADAVDVDLPLAPDRPRRRALVERWLPPDDHGGGDLAVLRLAEPVDLPVPSLRRVDEPWGRPFRVLGFPPGAEDGVWAAGTLRDEQGSGWLQVDADEGPTVGPGFSGAAIWDDDGAVVGVAVAAEPRGAHRPAVYALPAAQVLDLAPEVLVNPYRGLAAFSSDDAEFFFGRDAEIATCVETLEREGLLVVAGGSGTGKSSLLAAGLVPAETARGRRVARVRLTGADTRADMTEALAAALARTAPADWAAVLRDADRPAPPDEPDADHPSHPDTSHPDPGHPDPGHPTAPDGVLLVVDQLEDLVTASVDRARSAVELLLDLVRAGVGVATTSRWATFDTLLVGDSAVALQRATVGLTALDRGGLRRAVAEPARRVPGPMFSPGLVARIVDDAGDEPGRLPLVQTLLAELWERPENGRLTDAAYDAAGGVSGALVRSADRAWDALDTHDRPAARSLLLAMTRPTTTGFARRAVHLADLDDQQRRIVGALASGRLVTVGPGPSGDVVELAHQALIEHWPMLRTWLDDDAAFLRWRGELRAAVARWSPQQDPGTLLRGAELTTAAGWADDRGTELTGDERALIDASRRRHRRDRRIRQGAVAVLVVLVLLAGTLAAVVTSSNARLTRALDTANGRTLAQLAQARLPTDPGVGTQLALAAYRADPNDPDTRSAMGQAFAVRRSTSAVHTVPAGPVTRLAADPDVDVVGLGTPGGPVLAEGLTGPSPRFVPVPGAGPGMRVGAISGRGRWVVIVDPKGPARIWDRSSPVPPRPISRRLSAGSVTPDGAHLISTTAGATGSEVHLDDLATGATTALATLPEPDVGEIWQSADPARILVRVGNDQASTLTVRDAATGAVLRTLPPTSASVLGGAATVRCTTSDLGEGDLVVEDAVTGAPRLTVPGRGITGPCEGGTSPRGIVSADGRHVLWTAGGSGSSVDVMLAVDLVDGVRTTAWAPSAAGLDPLEPQSPRSRETSSPWILSTSLATVRGNHALVAAGGEVDTLEASTTPTWRQNTGGAGAGRVAVGGTVDLLFSPDQTVTRRVSDGAVLGQLDDRDAATPPGELPVDRRTGFANPATTWTKFGRTDRTLRLTEYDLPGLRPTGTYDLTGAGAGSPVPGGDATADMVSIARIGDRMVVLANGVLSWWSASTHQLVAPPQRVATDVAGAQRVGGLNESGLVTDGTTVVLVEVGNVSLWAPGAAPIRFPANLLEQGGRTVQLAGGRLATLEQPGVLVQHDMHDGHVLAPTLPVSPRTSGFLGVDPVGRLVTDESQTPEAMVFWDMRGDRGAGRVTTPFNGSQSDVLDGITYVDTGDDVVAFPVDDHVWHDKVCGIQDRAFTDPERAVLPAGADQDPPCES